MTGGVEKMHEKEQKEEYLEDLIKDRGPKLCPLMCFRQKIDDEVVCKELRCAWFNEVEWECYFVSYVIGYLDVEDV